jgi:hypothetical protein
MGGITSTITRNTKLVRPTRRRAAGLALALTMRVMAKVKMPCEQPVMRTSVGAAQQTDESFLSRPVPIVGLLLDSPGSSSPGRGVPKTDRNDEVITKTRFVISVNTLATQSPPFGGR